MVQIKPQEADAFLAKPSAAIRVVLIYGTDGGLVSERAASFAKAVLGGSDDPFALVRLDSAEIAADPGRLADEANTIALFGGNRAIRVRVGGNRPIQAAVEAVIAAPPQDAWIILEAGDIKKGTGLRKLCENARGAAAIACYADSGAAIDALIDQEVKAAALTIDDDARALLRTLLGSDRLASRSEIVKLCLYARDDKAIDVAAVRAVAGDAAAFAADEAIDAMALGDVAGFDRAFRHLVSSGTASSYIAASALRHLQLLHKIRSAMDDGAPAQVAIDSAGGFIFYQRKARLEQQVKIWTTDRLSSALERLNRAILDSRLKPSIDDEIAGQAMLGIASLARQSRRP